MSIIPDCTLTTSCFCVHNKNTNAFSVEEIIENIEELMKVPIYLVIYCDTKMYPIVKEQREKYGLGHLTHYNVIEQSDLWTYQYEAQVNQNREKYWPSRDPRAGTDSHLITSNKFDFVLKTIDQNPFQTTRFGWIDCFLRKGAKKVAEDYTTNMIPYILSNITEKFHIQILNVNDKRFKEKENKCEYYNQYRYVVCGCLFTCGKEIGVKILTRAKEIFVETVTAGYGHGEEMFYLEILDEFYDDIVRSYGDYGQILNNFISPTRNFYYIYQVILRGYYDRGYHKEYYDCAKQIVELVKGHRVNIAADTFFNILIHYYIVTFYHRYNEVKPIAEYIIELCSKNPYYKAEWMKNPGYYRNQLQHCIEVPENL